MHSASGHHSGHADKSRSRGSTVLKATLDAEFRVSKDGFFVTLEATKMKDAEHPAPLAFQMESVSLGIGMNGKPITSAALDLVQRPRPQRPARCQRRNDLPSTPGAPRPSCPARWTTPTPSSAFISRTGEPSSTAPVRRKTPRLSDRRSTVPEPT